MKNYLKIGLGLLMAVGTVACATQTTPVATNTATPTIQPTINTTAESVVDKYVFEGVQEEPIVVDSAQDVEITLRNVEVTQEGSCIMIKNAKSATIILEGENVLYSTGDAEALEPQAIHSTSDLLIEGEGTLIITSSDTAIKSETNLTIDSGTYALTGTAGNGLRANDTLIINDGDFVISAGECLEATYITINGGEFDLNSTDDAINASNKINDADTSIVPLFTMNNGNIKITMAQGDTDGIDSNGDIVINGGTIDITGQSAFDWDGDLTFNDGTVIVNGEAVKEIQNQFGEMGQGNGFGKNATKKVGPEMPQGGIPQGPQLGEKPQGEPPVGQQAPTQPIQEITEQQAKEIVLNHAQLSENDISYFTINKEFDNRIMEYNIDFYKGQTEYSYTVNANTGEIIEFEVDNN